MSNSNKAKLRRSKRSKLSKGRRDKLSSQHSRDYLATNRQPPNPLDSMAEEMTKGL